MELPVKYSEYHYTERWKVREAYIKLQDGLCYHCGAPLDGPPSEEELDKEVTPRLYPSGFFKHPIHLHHDHDTDLTIGAVHCHCNAVLWEYCGE